jgi:D-sedoheptulose 7-phosphate isomerase
MNNNHLDHLFERAPELRPLRDLIDASFLLLRDAIASGGKLLLCGNGGSAADADHWAGELLKGFKSKRTLSPAARAGLPAAIADSLQGAIPAIPLTGFAALTTAFANDVDGDLTFAQLTHALGRPGDVLIGLSTSGNARNVCAAATVARVRGLRILGLTGASGGTLAPLCDICLRVPAAETFRAQEFHLPIYHCLSLMLEDDFFALDT